MVSQSRSPFGHIVIGPFFSRHFTSTTYHPRYLSFIRHISISPRLITVTPLDPPSSLATHGAPMGSRFSASVQIRVSPHLRRAALLPFLGFIVSQQVIRFRHIRASPQCSTRILSMPTRLLPQPSRLPIPADTPSFGHAAATCLSGGLHD